MKNTLAKIKDLVDDFNHTFIHSWRENLYTKTKAEETIKIIVWEDKKIIKTEERVIEYTMNKPNKHLMYVSDGVKRGKDTEKKDLNIWWWMIIEN